MENKLEELLTVFRGPSSTFVPNVGLFDPTAQDDPANTGTSSSLNGASWLAGHDGTDANLIDPNLSADASALLTNGGRNKRPLDTSTDEFPDFSYADGSPTAASLDTLGNATGGSLRKKRKGPAEYVDFANLALVISGVLTEGQAAEAVAQSVVPSSVHSFELTSVCAV